ncbi:hypothetical protein SODALDRAFT_350476 [Sodiomyces alkalinus F11]|uniref:Uncharacterized protein n=1 Tax=Sodiomyces alkalinus (strain CBS 110278 / VKM F-3762 / F11) TaxID=1314773 RepID=A0A3N2PXP8_SODAK|nr:hypothetical protein SODALDRAFT_350476 [Sodiomyces alkalinus F11]ROT39309.1 hypothetical protein SODALDRAFT_350476 [Sodiomyces alkalinus F11]
MTRLGPLTAQALGRSPYDDVVEGLGEEDPREPVQQYDSRGRPVNPETKRRNREMIRAHNEVMQVIGVAEPDMGPSTAHFDSVHRHEAFEDNMGQRLLRLGRILEVGSLWGVNGLRARILIYKRYADISFFDLFRYERSRASARNLLLAGLPMFLAGHAWKTFTRVRFRSRGPRRPWLNSIFAYVRVHLQLYVAMQRLDIIPASEWLPHWSYFVIGSPSSPVPAPAPPKDLGMSSLLGYAGAWCLNATPFLAFVLWGRVWRRTTTTLWQALYAQLPNTVHNRRMLPPMAPPMFPPMPAAPTVTVTAETQPEPQEAPSRQPVDLPPQTRPELLRDISEQGQQQAQQAPDSSASASASASASPSVGVGVGVDTPATPAAPTTPTSTPTPTPRRPSVFSSRGGEDYSTEDEEEGGISATLISFDVEATESSDAPPGLWSAELRPSAGPDGTGPAMMMMAMMPTYIDTMLTRLPACLATDVFTVIASYVLLAPYEAVALRLVARMYRQRMGLPASDIYEPNVFDGLSWRLVTNFVGVEFLHLVVAGEVWAFVSMLAQALHATEDEWKEMEAAHAAQLQQQQQQEQPRQGEQEQEQQQREEEQEEMEQQDIGMRVQIDLQERIDLQEQMEMQQMQEEIDERERIHMQGQMELQRQIEQLERELELEPGQSLQEEGVHPNTQ